MKTSLTKHDIQGLLSGRRLSVREPSEGDRSEMNPYSRQRWFSVLVVLVAAVLFTVLLQPVYSALSQRLSELIAPWPWLLQRALLILLISGVWVVLIRLKAFRLRNLAANEAIFYPPIWVIGIVGSCIYAALTHYCAEALGSPWLRLDVDLTVEFGILILISVLVTAFVDRHLWKAEQRKPDMRQSVESGSAEELASISDRPELVLKWIGGERPIESPSQDLFGIDIIARRIADHLRASSMHTIGVVGPYGSGKSSLLNLVEYHLVVGSGTNPARKSNEGATRSFQGKLVVARVGGWGRTEGSVGEQILASAIDTLGVHIDCLSLITLPANYRDALSEATGTFGAIAAALLNRTRDPVSALERLDCILAASNMRLIIFLEDFDRNCTDSVIRDEVPALLDRLGHLQNVSFVLAVGTNRQYSEFMIRVCEHVESLT